MGNATPVIDLTNRRFGRIVCRWPGGRNAHLKIFWLCSCDCGNLKHILAAKLRNGETQSCGCLRKEAASKIGLANTRHGEARRARRSVEYDCYVRAKHRCESVGCKDYGN